MQIVKILNNNVAVIHVDQTEKIVMGRGICFKKKVGDSIDKSQIDKYFYLENPDEMNRLKDLLENIPIEYFQIGEEIIKEAKIYLGTSIHESLLMSLVDHINGALLRAKENYFIKNALLWDIRRFYKDEYQVGIKALDIIKNKTGIQLPIDEAGFIALYIVNGQSDNNIQETYDVTKIMQEIMTIIKYHFNQDINEDTIYFGRFITHLNYFVKRLIEKQTSKETDDDLLEIVKVKYKNAYDCVVKISEFLLKQYEYKISKSEMMYLTIHIHRAIYFSEEKS